MRSHRADVYLYVQRRQRRLSAWLAAIVLALTCAYAGLLSWLARDRPLGPLLDVRTVVLGLLLIYGVCLTATLIYSRWIRRERDPALRSMKMEHR